MPAANIAMMPANLPAANVPQTAAAAPMTGKPASGSSLFAQIVAQKMAAPEAQPACAKGAVPAPTNSTANVPQKKVASASTTSAASTSGKVLVNPLNPALAPILPASAGIVPNNSAIAVPANNSCAAWTIANAAETISTPGSSAIPDTSNNPAPNTGTVGPVSASPTSTSSSLPQIAGKTGTSAGSSTINTVTLPIESAPEVEIAAATLPAAVTISSATQSAAQDATLNQTGVATPIQTADPTPGANPATPQNSGNTTNIFTKVAVPPAVSTAVAIPTPEIASDPNPPAPQIPQAPQISKAPAATPAAPPAKVSVTQSLNSAAAVHPQLPTIGDVLKQVAAVSEKTNALAAAVNGRVAKDPLSAPVKGTSSISLDVPKSDLQSNALRSSAVATHQNAIDQVSVQKSSGAGTGNLADDSEPANSTLTNPEAKENTSSAVANFNGTLNVAQQNAPDPGGNPQPSGVTPATMPIAKDPNLPQASPASDSSRSDSSNNAVPDKSELVANTPELINNAQLAGTDAHSEMHIAMQTDKLGAVELHARVTGEQVGAAIMVEKREAHAALAVELPSLQQALSEKSLRVQSVVLLQGSLHSTAQNAGDHAQHQTRSQPGTAYRQLQETASLPPVFAAAAEPTGIFDDRGRLSVLA